MKTFSNCEVETLVELTEYLLGLMEKKRTSATFANLHFKLVKDRFDAKHRTICFTYNYSEYQIRVDTSNNSYSTDYILNVGGAEKRITREVFTSLYKRLSEAHLKTQHIGDNFQAILDGAIRADAITSILEDI